MLKVMRSSTIEVTAEANQGWQFVDWEGDLTGSDNLSTLIMDENKSVKAVFTLFEAGVNSGELKNISVTGTVTGGNQVGGIAGRIFVR